MLNNTPTLQVYQKCKQEICTTACAFLNTQGGQILCYSSRSYFRSKEDAEKIKNKIENLLRNFIKPYPDSRIHYHINGIDNNYFIEVIIEKSTSFHYVNDKGNKNYYIRAGKGNKKYNFEQNYCIKNNAYLGDGYYRIGNYPTGSKYFKYMPLETALQCLKNNNLWFVEPSKWKDEYERYFYNAEINGKKCSEDNPVLYATCVTNKGNSESAWKIYSYGAKKSDSLCVQFILNRIKLREQLIRANYRMNDESEYKPLANDYNIYEGVVTYKDEQIVTNLPKPKIKKAGEEIDNDWFNVYFNNFSQKKYLNLLLLKRSAFQHEQETRFFLVKKTFDEGIEKGDGHLDIQIQWKEIIEGVRYDSNCSRRKIIELKKELKSMLGLKKSEHFPERFVFQSYDVYSAPTPPVISSLHNVEEDTQGPDL